LAGHARLGEGRHAVVAGDRRLDDSDRQRGAGAFAEPHAEIEQRPLADSAQNFGVSAFGRHVRGEAMVERALVERGEDRRRGADDEAVEQHRNALDARGEDRAGDRRDLAPAEATQDLERIGEMLAMQRDGGAHGVGLARHPGVVGAGAAADPVLRRAAIKPAIDRRRRGGVADAHFAQTEQIGAGGERLHAEGHRRGAGLSSSAASRVMSPVGRSSASSNTRSEMSKVLQI
jgi:hypothetical protein